MPNPNQRPERARKQNPAAIILALLLVGAFPVAALLQKNRLKQTDAPVAVNSTPASTLTAPSIPSSAGPTSAALSSPTNALDESEQGVDIDKAAAHLTRGNELLKAEKFPEAIHEYQIAAKLNPEDEDAQYNLGVAYARMGNLDEARKAYEEALKLYPDYIEAHGNLGNLLVKQGDISGGITHFEAALNLDPNNPATHNNVGNALARKGQYDLAVPHFEKAIGAKPDYVEAQVNLANAYLLLNRTEDAVKAYSDILTNHPNFEPARKGLARAVQRRGGSDQTKVAPVAPPPAESAGK